MNKKIKKLLLLLLVFVMFLPTMVQAHEVYYLQTLIDDTSIQYKSYLIKDEAKKEGKHIENKESGESGFSGIGTLSSSINFFTGYNMSPSAYKNLDSMPRTNDEEELVFSFPPKVVKNKNGSVIHATGQHVDKAFEVKSILIPQLNEALKKINGDRSFKTAEELIQAAQGLLSNDMENWTIEYSREPDQKTGFYLATLENNNTKEKFEYQYAVSKGYSDPKSPLYHSSYKKSSDVITWHQLVAHANYFYLQDNPLYASNFAYANKTNVLDSILLSASRWMLNNIKDALEIFSIEDLVYNQGIRSLENVYYKGALTVDGLKSTQTFYIISLCIALSLLTSAVVFLLLKSTWSTMNTRSRVDLMEGLQNIIITAFILGLTYVFASVLLDINSKIVNIFASIQGGDELFTSADSFSAGFGAVIMSWFYFFICCYMNCVYIMRSIWLIILLGTGPLWIVGLAFGDKGKKFTVLWFKYLILNVFLQGFHAIFLTIFHSTLSGMRGIEAFVLCFSLIPLTTFFKKLILGDDGDLGGAAFMGTAKALGGMTSNLLSGVTKGGGSSGGGISAKKGGEEKKKDKKPKDDTKDKSSSKDGSSSDDSSSNSDKSLQNATPNDNYNELKNSYPSGGSDSKPSFKERLSNAKDGLKEGVKGAIKDPIGSATKLGKESGKKILAGAGQAGKLSVKAGKKVAKATVQNRGAIARGALKAAGNTARIAAGAIGAGMYVATGGNAGGELMADGAKALGSSVRSTCGTLAKGAKGGASILRDSYKEQKAENLSLSKDNEVGKLKDQNFSYSEKVGENGSVENAQNEGLYENTGIVDMSMGDEDDLNVSVDLSKVGDTAEDKVNYEAIRSINDASNYEELKEAVGSSAEKIAQFRGENDDFISRYKDHKLDKLEKTYDSSPKTPAQEQAYFNDYKKNYLSNLGVSNVQYGSNPDLMKISYNEVGKKEMGISSVFKNDKRTSVRRDDISTTNKFSYNVNEVNVNMGKVSYQKSNKTKKNLG